MVCHRCIMTVENILQKLDVAYSDIQLGEVRLKEAVDSKTIEDLRTEFEKVGFELIEDRDRRFINKIKSVLIEEVYSDDPATTKLSAILTGKLNYDYSHISHIFKENEGQSIQKFYNALRIERIKELLEYDETDISLIADKMGYSTAAYLSTSFKKATGYTPSEYKNRRMKTRGSIDSV
ncbi:AraC family transcriptional regulator [Christiangramia salexigens]|uniref:AraC family transcriptional regulator n=2 Tax=Christiangramia salexigens TaxID=1913577 RepID=A0A1L3J8L8_9FLAO|nr:AraC family transcriptional regulator [Christiangramia salexigens]